MRKNAAYIAVVIFSVVFLCIVRAALTSKIHDFNGKCLNCHLNVPDANTKKEDMNFTDNIDKLCSPCHAIDKGSSHPVNVKPAKELPLAIHLEKDGTITCTTCHDVHKEDKVSDRSQLSGLLWGHAKGRAFCFLCHNKNALGADWRHETAIPYAHPSGKFTQLSGGSYLDRFSSECLSCHDSALSKSTNNEVGQGVWSHELGMNHPIGVNYPLSVDFKDPQLLPKEIKLFEGKVGCLSCHNVYNKEKDMLVMGNEKSRLCLSCHKR